MTQPDHHTICPHTIIYSVNCREPLAQLAYGRIKDEILDQRLLPRQPLVEAELAARCGMSKTPIREALLTLGREELVEFSSFRGGRVRDFTAEDAREIYEVRELLEPFALGRAAQGAYLRVQGQVHQRVDGINPGAEELRASPAASWAKRRTIPRNEGDKADSFFQEPPEDAALDVDRYLLPWTGTSTPSKVPSRALLVPTRRVPFPLNGGRSRVASKYPQVSM